MALLDRDWMRPAPTTQQVRRDVVTAVVAAVLSVVSVEVWHSAYGVSVGWGGPEAYGWFSLAGLLLAGRRRFPLTTLVLESALFIVIGERLEEMLGIFTVQMILFAALYAAWAWSRRTRALQVVSAGVVVAMFGWLVWQFNQPGQVPTGRSDGLLSVSTAAILYALAINVLYFFGAMAWGHAAWRSARRQALIEEQAERERRRRAEEQRRAVQAERVRIARDLHDVVAHHISGMGVQAAGAGRLLAVEPDAARMALTTIEQSSRQAVSQMHQLVGLLRATEESTGVDRGPQPGLDDIAGLASAGGTPTIEHHRVGEPFQVPGTVALSLFRVAQEAVANVRRHAGARRATVTVRYVEGSEEQAPSVEVEVVDDGGHRPVVDCETGGFGLRGIRERADMHSGTADIGPRPNGGFRVRVRIPVTQT